MTSLMRLLFAAITISVANPSVNADEKASQEALRKVIDTAESAVVAIVVSHNPAYPALPAEEKKRPGRLGDYRSIGPKNDGVVAAGRDKLDLSLAVNAADNTFGSGVIVDGSGLVLTNYHLIQDARKIFLRFSNGHGTYADIHAADARCDLAVLKPQSPPATVKPAKLTTVQTWDETRGTKANVYRGLSVFTLAHPLAMGFNDGKASASTGIVSNVRRRAANTGEETRTGPLHQYGNLLQTDARLAVGVSGGGLFNMDGELIGLLSATAALAGSETAGGYAVPMDTITRRMIDVLITGREIEYGFLGVTADHYQAGVGLQLGRVSRGTPASNADLMAGDFITSVDGRPIRELDDLFLLVGGSLAANELKLSVTRGTRSFTVTPRLAKFAHTMPSIASAPAETVHGLRVEYTSILAQQPVFFGDRSVIAEGVLLRDAEPGSAAAVKLKSYLEGKRYCISAVNGVKVTTPAAFVAEAKKSQTVRLTLVPATEPNIAEQTVTLP